MPMVLIFSVSAFFTTSVYVLSQLITFKPLLKSSMELQALLNARSAAWVGMNILNEQGGEPDAAQKTAAEKDKTSSAGFGDDLFENAGDGSDSGCALTLEPGDKPQEIVPFSDSSCGRCLISLDSAGGVFRLLHAQGQYRTAEKKLTVTLGSQPFPYPDTVLFLGTAGMPEGANISGDVEFYPIDTVSSTGRVKRTRLGVSAKDAEEFIQEYLGTLSRRTDTTIREVPLTVKSSSDVSRVPKEVKGSLFVDGTNQDVEWQAQRRIYVLGDLQFTGEVDIRDVEFVVAGEIRVFDKSKLSRVKLFSQNRIFFADQSVFSGQAIALGDVEIYGTAVIAKRSTIITMGTTKSAPPQQKTQKAAEVTGLEGGESEPAPDSKKQKFFSLFIRDRAIVDGVVINLSKQYGIKTDVESQIRGILWAEGRICHEGRMQGVIRAQVLVDADEPANVGQNVMTGSIMELEEISRYHVPYFIGKLSILAWQEE
jgi:hypothetical protein